MKRLVFMAAFASCAIVYVAGQENQLFEDRTASSGIIFVTRNAASPEKHLIETMAGGVAVFDFDNDGYPDIYLVNGASQPSLRKTGPEYFNRLYRNRGDWTFEDVTTPSGLAGKGFDIAASPGDYDNDGNTDVFVASVNGGALYRNNGKGKFEDVTTRAGIVSDGWSVGAVWFDYDNDGFLDLFVVRYVKWNPAQEPWCGEPSPKVRTYCHPRFFEPTANQLFHNNGDGTFRDVSEASGIAKHLGKGMSAAIADVDGDGRLDLFVANDSVPNFLFHNEGGGRFREIGARSGTAYNDDGRPVSSMGSSFGDLDNDGREDLVVTALMSETFPFFRSMGDGTFVDQSYPSGLARSTRFVSGWGVATVDLDNDGTKDLLIAAGDVQDNNELFSSRKSKQENMVLWNNGKSFRPQAFGVSALHRAVAVADFDHDGRVDAVITRLNQTPLLLRNREASGHHWIGLRLEGRADNRQGIGALVTVRAGSLVRLGRCSPASGYASSSDTELHFGLGNFAVAEEIEIVWPTGKKQRVLHQAADQVLRIREPS